MKRSSTTLIENPQALLQHLKGRTHAYHLSNLFFRDFQYAILSFSETKGKSISYGEAEELARLLIASLEKSGILKLIKPGSWMLNYPEFKKVTAKSAASPKSDAAKVRPSTGQKSPGETSMRDERRGETSASVTA